MNVLIVENEKPAAIKLTRLLKKIEPEVKIAAVLETVEDTINWLQNDPSQDLILMDILLDDGTCFEIFQTINIETPIIFTTAYDEYALKAFQVNSIDYLLKPIDESSLTNAIKKYKSLKFNKESIINNISKVIKEFPEQYKSRYLVKIGSHYKSILVKDICYFYIVERNTFIKTLDGKMYSVEYSLDQVQKEIDAEKFFRINRNFIINIDSIIDIISFSSSRLNLKLVTNEKSEDFVVSREKVSAFKKWMNK
jgi:DNA-binding LytR/AlgR family response regulator